MVYFIYLFFIFYLIPLNSVSFSIRTKKQKSLSFIIIIPHSEKEPPYCVKMCDEKIHIYFVWTKYFWKPKTSCFAERSLFCSSDRSSESCRQNVTTNPIIKITSFGLFYQCSFLDFCFLRTVRSSEKCCHAAWHLLYFVLIGHYLRSNYAFEKAYENDKIFKYFMS